MKIKRLVKEFLCYKSIYILFLISLFSPVNAQSQKDKAKVKPWQIKGAIAAYNDKIPEVKAFGMEQLSMYLDTASVLKADNAQFIKLLSDKKLGTEAMRVLLKQKLSPEFVEKVAALLTSKDPGVRSSAVTILGNQKISLPIMNKLAGLLQSNDSHVVSGVANALADHKVSPEIIDQMLLFLKPEYQEKDYERRDVYMALAKQDIPPNRVNELIHLLRFNRDENLLSAAGWVLRGQKLSQTVIDQLVAMLDSQNDHIVDAAAAALGKQQLSSAILKKMIDILHHNLKNWNGIAWTITNQNLPPDVYSKLVGLIETTDNHDFQHAARYALETQKKIPPTIINRLFNLVKQKKHFARYTAAAILSDQTLSPQMLEEIADLVVSKTIDDDTFKALELTRQNLPASAIDKLIPLVYVDNSNFHFTVPEALADQELSDEVIHKLVLLLDSSNPSTQAAALKALSNRQLPFFAIKRILMLLIEHDDRYIIDELETALKGNHLNFEQISYILSSSYVNLNYAAKSRFFSHYLSGGDKEIETLLLWVGEPGANKPIASKLSSEERKRTLEIFSKAWGADYLHPKYRDDLANQIANVTQDIDPSNESLLKILKVHEKNLKKFPQQALITNKISEIENINWISTLIKTGYKVLLIHLLFWTLLIFVYPKERFKWIRPIFFWNDYVRKIAGLGYVHLLLTYVPFLRNILFVPFKSALIADARLESFHENSFFRDSNVMEAETGKVLSLIDELITVKGSVILRGESGLGKTMCLRNLARHNKHLVVFMTSEQCDKGVIEAIQRKIMGFAGDLNFLQSLVYMGAIQIYIDGLNEVGPQTRLIISDFLKNFGGVNCIVTTQPIDWVPPGNVKTYEILPLSPEQIGQFLDGRFQAFKTPEIAEESFKKLANDFIKDSTDPGLPEGELRQNEKILTNPMDLTIVAQMLIKDKRPNLLNLQKEYFAIMAEDFQRTHPHIIGGFPLQKFSENVFQMRLNDTTPLPYEEYHSEIECMEEHKMVLSRLYQSSGNEKQEWFFRHDKIRDFFIVQTFLRNPARQTEYLDDPRFRGVYFLLATYLSYEDAHSLREEIIQYAAETKDHSVSDEFIKLFKNRRGGAGADAPVLN